MKKKIWILLTAALAALSASATVFYSQDFEPLPGTATVKASDGKIRFGGNLGTQPSISSNEYAVGTIADGTGVSLVDDGSGTNNVLFVDGRYDKTYGGAVVIDSSAFGGTASVARLSFDLTYYLRKGGDGTACYVDVYAASGYDLSGATDAKIVMDLKNTLNTPTTVIGVNGSASASLLETLTFDHNTPLGNLDLSFNYDGSSAIVVVWESQYKSAFKVDNIQITDGGVIAEEGDPDVVFFGGDSGIFTGDVVTNNLFIGQTGAGQILQWNGVGDGSGQLSNMGVGGALTNTLNDLVLTTVDISPSGSNTFAFGTPNILGITGGDNGKFNTDLGEAWTFEFNKDVLLNQLVLAALDFDSETVRVTVDGVDTNSFTRLDANMTNLAWEATANKYIYTYTEPVLISAGTDITIDGTAGVWALQGLVVDVPSLIETLPIVNFGGNPDLKTNETYMTEVGGDAIVAWWGGDDDGGFITNGIGTLKDQGVGATLSSVKYDVTVETLAIESSLPDGTNTFVSGGSLGITGGDNAKLDSLNDEGWALEFDKDVYLWKVGLKGFTGGLEVADIIIGGVTNSIVPTDCVAATSESGLNIYTFATPVFIEAGTDVEIDAPGGQWGVGNLIIGIAANLVAPSYEGWLSDYPTIGSETNFTDNPDGDAFDNLAEYAFGGSPVDGGDIGNAPVFQTLEDGGTNVFEYVYFKRTDADARGLSYEVELSESLVPAAWTNIGYTGVDGVISDGFQAVTNCIPMDSSEKFIRLQIEL